MPAFRSPITAGDSAAAPDPVSVPPPAGQASWGGAVEIGLIVALIFVLAGTPPPDVNEAHYLAKAKHYWNPQWCARDLFLTSADAHGTFFWTFGWLTRFVSLEATAWIGRFVTWLFLAWGWRRLSVAILPGRFVAVFSAALFAALVHWGPMAGEWVFGGLEAKGLAFALVFCALAALVREQWRQAFVLSGGATAFHVLIGGWTLVALGVAWLSSPRPDRPSLRELGPALALTLLFAMPGVVPGLALQGNVDREIVREANHIYVFQRLAHHLIFHRLSPAAIAIHAALGCLFLVAWRYLSPWPGAPAFRGPLPRFVAAAFAIAVAGAVLDQSLLYHRPWAAAVLRYYWFRLSDVMTPLGVTWALMLGQRWWVAERPAAASWARAGLMLAAAAHAGWCAAGYWTDPRPGAVAQALPARELPAVERVRRWHEWQRLCQWVDANTDAQDLFLTPRNQQTFKWEANRAEVVNGKDVPQDAAGIVAWRKRMDDVFPYTVRFADLVAHGESRLRELAEKYGFRYIVIDRGSSPGPLRFPRVYPEPHQAAASTYEVYRVPTDESLERPAARAVRPGS